MNFRTIGKGIILILAGALLLANNLGYLPWEFWADLARFWPLLLIMAGLRLLSRDTRMAPVVSLLGVALFVAVVIWVLQAGGYWRGLPWWFPHRRRAILFGLLGTALDRDVPSPASSSRGIRTG